jgi:hypothetical protein
VLDVWSVCCCGLRRRSGDGGGEGRVRSLLPWQQYHIFAVLVIAGVEAQHVS